MEKKKQKTADAFVSAEVINLKKKTIPNPCMSIIKDKFWNFRGKFALRIKDSV